MRGWQADCPGPTIDNSLLFISAAWLETGRPRSPSQLAHVGWQLEVHVLLGCGVQGAGREPLVTTITQLGPGQVHGLGESNLLGAVHVAVTLTSYLHFRESLT
jgi:hypothetical protein